jgi:hypothetical protein
MTCHRCSKEIDADSVFCLVYLIAWFVIPAAPAATLQPSPSTP